jgi:hypothetical protein
MPLSTNTGTEKESLRASLGAHRRAVRWKLDGLSDDQLRQPMTSSGTNLLGLVKHLGGAEYSWFCETFGRAVEPYPFDFDVEGSDLRVEPGETTSDIIEFYSRACDAADGVLAESSLDEVGTSYSGSAVSLRWVLIHMLAETARHAGHMDIIRELIDGATGAFPQRQRVDES